VAVSHPHPIPSSASLCRSTQVTVQFPSGREVPVTVYETAAAAAAAPPHPGGEPRIVTVGDLKRAIQVREGVLIEQQRILFDGTQLQVRTPGRGGSVLSGRTQSGSHTNAGRADAGGEFRSGRGRHHSPVTAVDGRLTHARRRRGGGGGVLDAAHTGFRPGRPPALSRRTHAITRAPPALCDRADAGRRWEALRKTDPATRFVGSIGNSCPMSTARCT
jgi:hypothetical protein